MIKHFKNIVIPEIATLAPQEASAAFGAVHALIDYGADSMPPEAMFYDAIEAVLALVDHPDVRAFIKGDEQSAFIFTELAPTLFQAMQKANGTRVEICDPTDPEALTEAFEHLSGLIENGALATDLTTKIMEENGGFTIEKWKMLHEGMKTAAVDVFDLPRLDDDHEILLISALASKTAAAPKPVAAATAAPADPKAASAWTWKGISIIGGGCVVVVAAAGGLFYACRGNKKSSFV